MALSLQDVVLKDAADGGAFRKPERKASPNQFVDCEEFKLFAEAAVIAFASLLRAGSGTHRVLFCVKKAVP